MMNIILLGPQGSGKGTQAEELVKKFGLHYFEAGKILRSISESDNKYAEEVKKAINGGRLVPDEYMRLIAWDFINKHEGERENNKGFLFDGYPRSTNQYEHLKDMLMRFGQGLNMVVNIEISEAESIKRLSARRTCQKCGEIYNLITNPPPEGRCKCGGEMIQRDDDRPEAIKRRLAIYREQTHPVFEKARDEGIGIEIDGERPINTISEDLVSRIMGAESQ